MAFMRSKKIITAIDTENSVNKKLPYEELLHHQLNDLPVPDKEQSWQKMKQLLENDDDDRIVPPVLMRGCFGWSLLSIALLVIFWLVVHPERWWKNESISKIEKTEKQSPDSINVSRTIVSEKDSGSVQRSWRSPKKKNQADDSLQQTHTVYENKKPETHLNIAQRSGPIRVAHK